MYLPFIIIPFLNEDVPLKEGLKQELNIFYSRGKKKLNEDVPLKEGLKPYRCFFNCFCTRLNEDVPLKEGLKLAMSLGISEGTVLNEDVPLKEGLKHCRDFKSYGRDNLMKMFH